MFSSVPRKLCINCILSACIPKNNVLKNLVHNEAQEPRFGILFDIDGVIVREKKVLPCAIEAFSRLVKDGKFKVPTVFVTNAGNALRTQKAQQLSEWLDVNVKEDQVVMAHSPLKLCSQFHDKHVLISGQGPIVEIAKNCGFTKLTTIDDFRSTFPLLDAVDHKRRVLEPNPMENEFEPIEAIVLFGEPVRWETSLQLIIDALITNGLPNKAPYKIFYPHIPVLACNMDLQWMSAASIPRFGHGSFLLCLETLYNKITGYPLIYSALIGKPSEITYHHAHQIIAAQAKELGITRPLKRLYAIGDNVFTDVFGANLYNRFLSSQAESKFEVLKNVLSDGQNMATLYAKGGILSAESCCSILVTTGVFNPQREESRPLNHFPRDFVPNDAHLSEPKFTLDDVSDAINQIFLLEDFK